MATYDLEEQEQLDALKAWWKRNGNTVILTVAVFFATVAAVQGWRHYQSGQATKAMAAYEALQSTVKSGDAKKASEIAGQIMEQYGSTAYAPRAALAAANLNYGLGDLQNAKAQLQWAAEHSKEDEIRDIAHLRLAGVLLDEKNYAEAMKQVDAPASSAFEVLFSDMKGDILAAQGKSSEARIAYQSALDKLDVKSPYRQLLQLKLDGLGA